jgi:alpha-tubulin suppressor-like RCC1 family protein
MIRYTTIIFIAVLSLAFLTSCEEVSTLKASASKTLSKVTPADDSDDEVTYNLSIKAPSLVEINNCVPLIVNVLKNATTPVSATEDFDILVDAQTPIYSDSSCLSTQSNNFLFPKKSFSKTIYVRPSTNQSYVFFFEDKNEIAKPQNFILSVTNPLGTSESLKLSLTGPTSLTAGLCRSYVVSLQNTLGVNKNSSGALAITLSGEGSGSFYSGTNCLGGSVSTVAIPDGAAFVSFSYKNSTAENVNLIADSPLGSLIQSSFYSVQVNPVSTLLPTQLVLTGPTSVTAGACSGPVVVKTVDALFNSTAVIANLNFTLTGGAGFTLFTNAACSTVLTTPVISTGNSSMSFYFKMGSAGNYVITADDGASLTDAALSVQATAAAGSSATKFDLSGPTSVKALECSSAYVLKTTNGSGIESPVSSTTNINLTGKGAGDFYADAACITMISGLTFASGDSSQSFYYKGTIVSNLTFNADDTGPLVPSSIGVSIVADVPSKLILSGPTPVTLGDCRLYTVTAKDANNFVSAVSAATSINLTGASGGAFYSDASCVNSTTSVIINSGQVSGLFYYKNLTAQAITLSADNSGGLTAGTLPVTINPLSYSKVVMTRPSLVAGTCTPITVTLKDSLNNSTAATSSLGVNLTKTGSATYYSASNCLSGAITSTTVTTGLTSSTVYITDNVAETISLGANATGLTSDAFSSAVVPGPNNLLKLTGPATDSVGNCIAYDLRLEDAFGNLSGAASSLSVNFAGLSNAKFYSDAACSSLLNSAMLSTSQSQYQLYLKGTSAESLTISASSGALTSASKAVSLIPGSSNKLILSGSTTVTAGSCSLYSVQVQDSFSNPITQGSNLTVAMSGNISGNFYSDSGCTSSTSTVTIISGANSASVYFKSNVPASLSLVSSGASLFDGNKSITVNPMVAAKLVLTGAATTSTGVCTPYSVTVQDVLNNLSPVGTSKVLNFSGAGTGAFYSDVSCSIASSSLTLTSTQTSAQIYYKASTAQTPNLSVDDAGLPDLASSVFPVTVNASGGSTTIVLKIAGSSSINNNTCVPYAVMTTDTGGISYNVSSNLTATMAGAGTGTFYSDSGCTTTSSTVTVASGTSLSYVYYKSALAQNLVFSATSAGASTTTFPVTVNSSSSGASASKITIAGSGSIYTNACIPYVVSLADSSGNSLNASANTSVTFSGHGSGTFYSDDACAVSTAASTIIANGSSFATVYYKNAIAQNLILMAQSAGLSNGTLPLSITTAPVVNNSIALKLSGSNSISTNTCVPYAVMTTDTSGVSTNVTSNLSVIVGGAGTGTFYSDSGCVTSSASVTVSTGTSLSYVYYKSVSSQNLVFSATSAGASATTFPVAVINGSGAGASRVTIAGSNSILTNQCIPYVISVADTAGNSINATANTTVNFSGEGSGGFYSDNACTATIGTATTILSGTSYTTVYYKNAIVQNLILVAQSSGLSNGTLTLAISSASGGAVSGPAVKLSFVAQPSAVASVSENFGIQPIVAVQDTNNNIASTASNTITLAAFTDSSCTLSAGAVITATTNPLNANGGIANFAGLNATTAQIIYLKASSPGLASACSSAIQVYPAIAAKLAFTQQPSSSAVAGINLSTQPQVSIYNYTNQVVTSATNTVTITPYTDSSCSMPASGTFNIAGNNLIPSSGVATFSGINYNLPATIYLKASASGLTSACSTGISVSPGAPYLISIHTQPTTAGTVGSNFGLTVRLYDSFGSLSPAAHNILVTAYKSSNCSGATSSLSGNSTTSVNGTATFSSIVFSEIGTMSLKITDTTNGSVLSACTNAIAIDGGAPTKLTFQTQPASSGKAYSTFLSSPVVRVEDAANNIVTTSINPITISAYTNSGCTTPAGGTLFSTASLTSTPSYGLASFGGMSYSTAQTIYLKATSAGLTSACSNAVTVTGMAKKISANEESTCAVMEGNVYCWGSNTYNRVGNSFTGPNYNYPSQVVGVGGVGFLSNITDVALGLHHVCALDSAGSVYCWGRNDYGQIGDNTTVAKNTPIQVLGVGAVGNLSGITDITAGYLHTCALNSSGNVFCWGYNGHGQMGDNTTTTRNTPVQVKGVGNVGNLSNITSISSSDYHDCGLSNAGEVYCWGYNGYGQMGVNNGTQYYTPVKVLGVGAVGNLSNIVQLSSGGHGSYGFNCVVNNAGNVYCWGYGGNGELGDNTAVSKSIPVQVKGVANVGNLSGISSVSAGGYHACSVATSGSVYCWGHGPQGQLGDNGTVTRYTPVQVLGIGGTGNLNNIIAVASGSYHTCSVANDGQTYCWGQNNVGQLGDQTITYRSVPVKVVDINTANFTQISVGYNNVCGVARERVYCYGYNTNGELGDGTTVGKPYPSQVVGLTGVKQVSMGQNHGCALTKTGDVYCWGYNAWGQLGDNATNSRTNPVQVLGVGGVGYLTNIVSISASNWHTCAVNTAGAVFCWGNNGNAQIGDGTTTERRTPVQVLGENGVGNLSNIVSVSTGYWHTCALNSSGGVLCWGYNGYQQLGDNSGAIKYYPTQVSGLSSGVSAISAGHSNTCAIKNGAGYCWGYVSYANSNANYYIISSTPSVIWPSGVTSISGGTETVSAIVNGKMRAYSPVAYYAYHPTAAGDTFSELVSISENHTVHGHPMYCALRNTGTLYCWGYNNYLNIFNVGNNGSFLGPSMVVQPTYNDVISTEVATGDTHSCGNINGIAQCWGTSAVGALGTGGSSSISPAPVLKNSDSSKLGGQASIAAGSTHTCSITAGGDVYCWGDNTNGKLGNNSTVATNKAVRVLGVGGSGYLTTASSIGVGFKHNCAVSSGKVYCWGNNTQGQLGIDSTMSMGTPVQTKGVGGVGFLTGATQVVAGREHSCAIKNGYVYCWGSNQYGQLGANTGAAQINTTVQVVNVSGVGALDGVTDLTAGAYHTCALSGGITYCWGANTSKQLGNDSYTDSSYPVGVMNEGYITLTNVASIKSGARFSCATTILGEVMCWGAGANGQLGNNLTIDSGVASYVVGLGAVGNLNVSSIGAGSSSSHVCGLKGDLTSVYCWGKGSSGQLGTGTTPASQAVPLPATINVPANFVVK